MTKIMSCAAVVGLLVASSSCAFAKGPGGAPVASPGQAFVGAGRTPTGGTPGASGYSPGQQYLTNKTTNGAPGASIYAPGFLK